MINGKLHPSLEEVKCKECNRTIIVNTIEPIEEDLRKYVNGVFFKTMDEYYEEHHIGYLCYGCSGKLCSEGHISMSDDALAMKSYFERYKTKQEGSKDE